MFLVDLPQDVDGPAHEDVNFAEFISSASGHPPREFVLLIHATEEELRQFPNLSRFQFMCAKVTQAFPCCLIESRLNLLDQVFHWEAYPDYRTE